MLSNQTSDVDLNPGDAGLKPLAANQRSSLRFGRPEVRVKVYETLTENRIHKGEEEKN